MVPIIALLTMALNNPSYFVLMLVLFMKNAAPYESKVVAKRGINQRVLERHKRRSQRSSSLETTVLAKKSVTVCFGGF